MPLPLISNRFAADVIAVRFKRRKNVVITGKSQVGTTLFRRVNERLALGWSAPGWRQLVDVGGVDEGAGFAVTFGVGVVSVDEAAAFEGETSATNA
jgi:hypothetical protein